MRRRKISVARDLQFLIFRLTLCVQLEKSILLLYLYVHNVICVVYLRETWVDQSAKAISSPADKCIDEIIKKKQKQNSTVHSDFSISAQHVVGSSYGVYPGIRNRGIYGIRHTSAVYMLQQLCRKFGQRVSFSTWQYVR